MLVALALGAAACSVSSSTNSNGVGQGIGANDASGDVKLGDCKSSYGIVECQLTITNSSDGTSDYFIEGVIENAAGDNIGDGNGTASHVAGGQTARTKLTLIANGNPKDYTVKITTVQRTASA
jgi:hypothetical protein